MEIFGIYFPLMRKTESMIALNDIAIFARVVQVESFSRAARALGMPGHAMLGFKIDQQKGGLS
jgi:hypothetical protein